MNKFLRIITSFPFIVSTAIALPTGVSVLSTVLSPKFNGNLGYFQLQSLDIVHETFKVEKVQKLFKVANYSSFSNYQGGACYTNYYALCANNFENILIYDMNTFSLKFKVEKTEYSTDYHCNTIAFGTTFYDTNDLFPLLYVSMESPLLHSTYVYRLVRSGRTLEAVQVQAIVFDSAEESGIYLPNSYIDHIGGYLYYSGYTKNSYNASDDNKLAYFKYEIPPVRDNIVYLHKDNALDSFELPSQTATQGGFISQGYLYQSFAFKDDPKFRIVDLNKHKLVYETSLGDYGPKDEFENVVLYNNKIFGFGIKTFSIFEFEFSAEFVK